MTVLFGTRNFLCKFQFISLLWNAAGAAKLFYQFPVRLSNRPAGRAAKSCAKFALSFYACPTRYRFICMGDALTVHRQLNLPYQVFRISRISLS